jgi:ribose/xylose/arabinose/galactoside ABC-type transport system permease subunit
MADEKDELVRVAILTEQRLSILETEMNNFKDSVGEIKGMLAVLVASMNKNKGFWAGALAAGTALGAALGALMSYIFHTKVG